MPSYRPSRTGRRRVVVFTSANDYNTGYDAAEFTATQRAGGNSGARYYHVPAETSLVGDQTVGRVRGSNDLTLSGNAAFSAGLFAAAPEEFEDSVQYHFQACVSVQVSDPITVDYSVGIVDPGVQFNTGGMVIDPNQCSHWQSLPASLVSCTPLAAGLFVVQSNIDIELVMRRGSDLTSNPVTPASRPRIFGVSLIAGRADVTVHAPRIDLYLRAYREDIPLFDPVS